LSTGENDSFIQVLLSFLLVATRVKVERRKKKERTGEREARHVIEKVEER